MSNRQIIAELMGKLQYLPNHPTTDKEKMWALNCFEDDLSDLPIETIEAAITQYRATATFFPTSGNIRELAMDLQMLIMGVPSPAEAWGMVLTAERHVSSQWCQTGADLREAGLNGGDTKPYHNHMDKCDICTIGGLKEVYNHPIVNETVKILGGRAVIITDNPTADRARFIDAYREIVSRERKKSAMLPEVKGYIAQNQAALTINPMKQLTKGMSK